MLIYCQRSFGAHSFRNSQKVLTRASSPVEVILICVLIKGGLTQGEVMLAHCALGFWVHLITRSNCTVLPSYSERLRKPYFLTWRDSLMWPLWLSSYYCLMGSFSGVQRSVCIYSIAHVERIEFSGKWPSLERGTCAVWGMDGPRMYLLASIVSRIECHSCTMNGIHMKGSLSISYHGLSTAINEIWPLSHAVHKVASNKAM